MPKMFYNVTVNYSMKIKVTKLKMYIHVRYIYNIYECTNENILSKFLLCFLAYNISWPVTLIKNDFTTFYVRTNDILGLNKNT